MKATICCCLLALGLLAAPPAAAQNYADGIDNLMEVKHISEDLARTIRLEWDHNSEAYRQAKNLYNDTRRTVETMIGSFDAKIRSGSKIKNQDIERYVQQASDNCDAMLRHYNAHSPAGGTNSLFGLSNIFAVAKDIINGVNGALDAWKGHKTQVRLEKMHGALDGCKLAEWDKV
jgi:hypothetical protein